MNCRGVRKASNKVRGLACARARPFVGIGVDVQNLRVFLRFLARDSEGVGLVDVQNKVFGDVYESACTGLLKETTQSPRFGRLLTFSSTFRLHGRLPPSFSCKQAV